jgi:hypothetical protein
MSNRSTEQNGNHDSKKREGAHMAQQPFNAEATNREELMSSRSRQFVEVETRAVKGQRLTREERQLMIEYTALSREVGRYEPDPDSPY